MKITLYIVFLVLADLFLTNVDRFWINDTDNMQFFVYDVATFGRIGLLASFCGLILVLKDKIAVKKIDLIIYGLYWIYALYEFHKWLNIQHGFING